MTTLRQQDAVDLPFVIRFAAQILASSPLLGDAIGLAGFKGMAKVLDDLATAARDRISLRQQVAALSAQQRLSAWVLVLLPYAISLAFFLADRTFLQPLVDDPIGRLMVLAASMLLASGAYALRLAGRVEY